MVDFSSWGGGGERWEFEKRGGSCSHWIPLELQRGRWRTRLSDDSF